VKLAFVCVGGHKEKWLVELTEDYQKRLQFFFKTEVLRLKPSKISRESSNVKCREECEAILGQLEAQDFVVLCDEKGRTFTSSNFSKQLVKWCENQKSRIVFVICGAYGASENLKTRANFTLSLSELTFNHHFAQAILLEQIYRAIAIWKNLPYHNE
jgi:23S rRNA (pseudouridine1915-N3)-methyltransferase